MTTLHAAGGGLPLALTIPKVVEQAGSLAGFAAVIGLAVLSALYFSQARDLRRLREWAGRAPERAAELGAPQSPVPGKVVAVPQRQPAQQQAAGTNGDAAPKVAAAGAGASAAVKAGDAPAEKTAEDGAAKPAGDATAGDAAKDGDAKPDAEGPAAKPGMPAPASAAAAAGATAASAAGPAAPPAPGSKPAAPGSPASPAPGSKPAAPGSPASPAPGSKPAAPPASGAPGQPRPQRPPGSVLPPRTGTLPPVRRLPASNAGPGQTGVLGQAPPKKKRNPVYVALAVIGVLVLGGGAAIGVPALVNGDSNDSPTTASRTTKQPTKKAAPTPGQITVAVLNGTSIPGLAAQIADRAEADGFRKGTVSNASLTQGQRANSVVMYASGHRKDARIVARKLDIGNVQAADSETQQIAGDASVIVVVGTDKTQ